jgi:hypothetical protein
MPDPSKWARYRARLAGTVPPRPRMRRRRRVGGVLQLALVGVVA